MECLHCVCEMCMISLDCRENDKKTEYKSKSDESQSQLAELPDTTADTSLLSMVSTALTEPTTSDTRTIRWNLKRWWSGIASWDQPVYSRDTPLLFLLTPWHTADSSYNHACSEFCLDIQNWSFKWVFRGLLFRAPFPKMHNLSEKQETDQMGWAKREGCEDVSLLKFTSENRNNYKQSNSNHFYAYLALATNVHLSPVLLPTFHS